MITYSASEFNNAIEKCKIMIDRKELGNVDFLNKNKAIILGSLFEIENQRNLVLHPYTNLIFFQTLILSALNAFYNDSMNSDNLLAYLMPGDMVVHLTEKRRYKVLEVNHSDGYIKLQGSKGLTNKVPMTAKFIKPYYGNAKSLDGRGIRMNGFTGIDFFASLFEVERDMIKTTIDRSIVVVCQKHDADMIMDSLILKVDTNKNIRFEELLPCAYYSSASDWINYAGNSANLDSVVKFTNKLSVARELVLEDKNKRIQGVIVNGSEYMSGGISELNDLLTQKSLRNVTMLAPISFGDYSKILEQYSDIKLFAWTNEALLSVIEDLNDACDNNCVHEDVVKAYQFIDNICQKNIEITTVEPLFEAELPKVCKQSLYNLKRSMTEGEDKDYFITYGYSLLNLMEQSCFSINMMEEFIIAAKTNIASPSNTIKQLNIISNKHFIINDEKYEDMKKVTDSLGKMKDAIQKSNPKYEYLKNYLLEIASEEYNSVAVVMAKTYYCSIFLDTLSDFERYKISKFDYTTPNKFNMKKQYNKVIILSIPESTKFNAAILPNSANIDFISYQFESWRIESLKARTIKLMDYYDNKNSIKYGYFGSEVSITDEVEKHEDYHSEMDRYVDNMLVKVISETLNKAISASSSLSEVVKFVSFESGEYVFFSKYYLPYKYNPTLGTVEETDVDSLEVGDTLVFAKIDDENKDIVDRVLNRLISSKKLNSEQETAYIKSKHWKDVLRFYMNSYNITFSELSARMNRLGKVKHEVTLRTWLDEDSRIVGPRDSESFYAIALLTDNKEMLENPDDFCEACRIVRSMRIKILKFIGKSIINSVAGKADDTFEENLLSITTDVKQMVKMLQIEKIENTKTNILAYMANRPHYLS